MSIRGVHDDPHDRRRSRRVCFRRFWRPRRGAQDPDHQRRRKVRGRDHQEGGQEVRQEGEEGQEGRSGRLVRHASREVSRSRRSCFPPGPPRDQRGGLCLAPLCGACVPRTHRPAMAKAYDPRDRFWQKAKKEGLRARSAFKLDEIQRRFHVLRPGGRVLDLGAAPGGWCQIAAREVGAKGFVLGLDLEPIARLPAPAETWVADAFAPDLPERLRREGRAPYDAVLSDLAPKTSGVRSADEARSLDLAGRALGLSLEVLRSSGFLVVKVFMGGDFESFLKQCRQAFRQVRVVRPEASVARGSKEVYLVCREPRRVPESATASNGSTPEGGVGPEGS